MEYCTVETEQEKCRSKDYDRVLAQLLNFLKGTYYMGNPNDRLFFISRIKSTVEEFENEFYEKFGGNCTIDRSADCQGCGFCGEIETH